MMENALMENVFVMSDSKESFVKKNIVMIIALEMAIAIIINVFVIKNGLA